MTIGTLSVLISAPVVLGTKPFGETLSIAPGGGILPAPSGATALLAPEALSRAAVNNSGVVVGGGGTFVDEGAGGNGGNAIVVQTRCMITNYGAIVGGVGGETQADNVGGRGGVGILLDHVSTIDNSGEIDGGNGGNGGGYTSFNGTGGNAGAAIYAEFGGVISNTGTIVGGAAGYGRSVPGIGGAGILLGGYGTVINHGFIKEGASSYAFDTNYSGSGGAINFAQGGKLLNDGEIRGANGGSVAVAFDEMGVVDNSGSISGGGGEIGLQLSAGGTVHNSGVISGGEATVPFGFAYPSTDAEAGVDMAGAGRFDNAGTITGGSGAYSKFGYQNNGATAATLTGLDDTLHNSQNGLISGGQGGTVKAGAGGWGGDGIDLAGGTLVNDGSIDGGNGGSALGFFGNAPIAGSGGIGVVVTGGTLANAGSITGGMGGTYAAADGSGGSGLILDAGSVRNSGTIIGGATPGSGGSSGDGLILGGGTFTMLGGMLAGGAAVHGGTAGAGALLNAGTLDAIGGTITGAEASAAGTPGDAVQFGTATASTLVIHPDVTFSGAIVGYAGLRDRIVLAAGGDGQLDGFGAPRGISGITQINEDAGAHWLLSGTVPSLTSLSLGANSQMALSGVDRGNVYFAPAGSGQLILKTPSGFADVLHRWDRGDGVFVDGVHASSFTFSDGTLSLLGSSGETLDTLFFDTRNTTASFMISNDKAGTSVQYQGETETKLWDHSWHASLPF